MVKITFEVYPNPGGKTVIVHVQEGSHAAGTFEVTVAGWTRVLRCLTPGPGVRIRDFPP